MTTRPTSFEDYLRRYRDKDREKSPLEALQECWDDAHAEGRAEGVAVSKGAAQFWEGKFRDAYSAGHAAGMKDAEEVAHAKLESSRAIARFYKEKAEGAYSEGRASGYATGHDDGVSKKAESTKAEQSAEHPDTRRLINELYHDRARLEKVVADAVALAQLAEETIDMLRKTATVKTANGLSSSLVLGSLSQFQDTHGDD